MATVVKRDPSWAWMVRIKGHRQINGTCSTEYLARRVGALVEADVRAGCYSPSIKEVYEETAVRSAAAGRGVAAEFDRLLFEIREIRSAAFVAAHNGEDLDGHTVLEVVEAYIARVLPHKPGYKKRAAIERATMLPAERFHSFLQKERSLRWWAKRLGADRQWNTVTALQITDALNDVRDYGRADLPNPRPLSGSSISNLLTSLSGAVKDVRRALHWRLNLSPFMDVQKPTQVARKRTAFLEDPNELAGLLRACEDVSQDLYDFVVVAIGTGARRRTIEWATWSQFRDDGGEVAMLVIPTEETKGNQEQKLIVAGKALETLRRRRAARRQDTELIWPRVDGARPKDFKSQWRKARVMAGVKMGGGLDAVVMHTLRHRMGVDLAESGLSAPEIKGMMYHASAAASEHYFHLGSKSRAELALRVQRHLAAKGAS